MVTLGVVLTGESRREPAGICLDQGGGDIRAPVHKIHLALHLTSMLLIICVTLQF